MAEGKMESAQGMTTRQKVIIGAFVVILLIIAWQIYGLFGGSSKPPSPVVQTTTTTTTRPRGNMMATSPAGGTMGSVPPGGTPMQEPQNAQLIKQQPMSQREMELMKLQQETQAKYIAALNELQLLKVSRDIAETNQDIAKAKLATVAAEKNIISLLSPPAAPPPSTYATGLVNPVSSGPQPSAPPVTTTTTTTTAPTPPEAGYTVVSVSQLQHHWNAVIGYQGNLYNVAVGDVLPTDGSKVIEIDRSGVWLEKNNIKKKVSLVPII